MRKFQISLKLADFSGNFEKDINVYADGNNLLEVLSSAYATLLNKIDVTETCVVTTTTEMVLPKQLEEDYEAYKERIRRDYEIV